MDHLQFFPSPESVFAGNEGDFFVPLASVDFGALIPGQAGPVHFLRPRVSVEGEPLQILGQIGYPNGWYAFRRDEQGGSVRYVRLAEPQRSRRTTCTKPDFQETPAKTIKTAR